jgi:putative tricarboxylic transport membrane protein
MGVLGYLLRKLDFDPAPLVLGLVIAPTFELSLRQSLVMSNGNWGIFASPQRPIAAALLAVCGLLLVLAAASWLSRRDWRKGLPDEGGSG